MHEGPVVIYGAGGQGRVVLDILRADGRVPIIGFLDSDPSLVGMVVDGLQVLGTMDAIPGLLAVHGGLSAVVAIGDNRTRWNIAAQLEALGVQLTNAVHPKAYVSPTAHLGRNVTIAVGAIVCAHARIGNNVIVNTGAIVEHENVIEDNVHVAPGVRLAGRVVVRYDAFVGIGATVVQNLEIGAGALIGAGAVVLTNVPPGATFAGVPARNLKSC